MTRPEDEMLGGSPRSRSAAARNASLNRVEQLLQAVAPTEASWLSSSRGGGGEAPERSTAEVRASTAAGVTGDGHSSSRVSGEQVAPGIAEAVSATFPGVEGRASTSAAGDEGAAAAAAADRVGTPSANQRDFSTSGHVPIRLTSYHRLPSADSATISNAFQAGIRATSPPPFRARTGTRFSGRAGGARISRSISSRSRRATSISSAIRLLVPAARGLGPEILAPPRTLSGQALCAGPRRASPSSPSSRSVSHGVGAVEPRRRRILERDLSCSSPPSPPPPQQQEQPQRPHQPQPQPQQQQQGPLTGYLPRTLARHTGGRGRVDGGRASMRRLSSGERDSWRAPVVAYNVVERRTGRDSTALRAVSARLDAAATAIDAVEIGVRSASDSLDSLLQLLESQSGSPVVLEATSGGGTSIPGGNSEEDQVYPTAIAGGASGRFGESVPLTTGDNEADQFSAARGRVGGGGLRAANMLRRELTNAPGLTADQPQADERIDADARGQRSVASSTPYRAESAAEGSVVSRETLEGESKEDLHRPTRSARVSNPALTTSRPETPSRWPERGGEITTSRVVEEPASSEGHGAAGPTIAPRRRGDADESARHAEAPTTEESEATIGLTALSRLHMDSTQSPNGALSSDHPSESRQAPPHEMRAADSTGAVPANEAGTTANPDRSDLALPVLELEVAMSGIDAERGRLMVEIARLRGQQNQSLLHLQRLQHEQFIVRQRQVSTLSDIVNSFGRTVEAAGALPHGEDSPLGRISSDVVSTLRRMLRLLSATVPAAAPAPAERSIGPTLGSLPLLAEDHATSTPGGAQHGSSGGDLTQEVIDAALQALPRLAAAATAISGARRMQGYLAGLAGGATAGTEDRRCCSKETIAALPDALLCTAGAAGGVGSDEGGVVGCVICLSEGNASEQLLCRLPCNHVFHRSCVGKWLMLQDSCPTCRSQVPNVKAGSPTAAAPVV